MSDENIFVYKGGARFLTASGGLQWEDAGPEVPEDVESIIVDPSVTKIGKFAFSGCSELTSIVIPSSVTSIGGYAFFRCKSLTNVVIPDSVTEIGEEAFRVCSKLTSIVIPSSIQSIGDSMFGSCTSLATVDIPVSVESIGANAFDGCESLASIDFPDSITEIGSSAFRDCAELTSIAIPASIKSIERGTFQDCTSLATVVIPNSVESIHTSAFLGCPLLQTIRIKDITATKDTGKRSINEMSFDDLEKVYHERKRLKSIIDLTTDANAEEGINPDGSGAALRNQVRQQQQYTANLVRVKKEKSAVKDDLEIEKETLTQQYLATDIWQSRFDEVVELAQAAGVDGQKIAEIRSRSLASGK